MAIVVHVDLIFRQSNAFAKNVFGEDVESQLLRNGRLHEAQFTRVFRRWYEVEEEAGIPASDTKSSYVNEIISLLLGMLNLGIFPPRGRHVKGTVMFAL